MSSKAILPPHSLTAEKAVLGAVLSDPKVFVNVSDIIEIEHFYLDIHKLIYEVITNLDSEGRSADIITVAEIARQRGKVSVSYLSELVDSCPITLNIEHYATVVRDYFVRRNVIDGCRNIIKKATQYDGGNAEFLEEIEKEFQNATEVQQTEGLTPSAEVLSETLEELDRRMKLQGKLSGVPSGFRDLDKLTGGWQKSDLIILAARPGMGKTALALNWVTNALKKEHATVIFSLEMSKTQLMMRLLSTDARVNSAKMRSGEITDREQDKLMEGARNISQLPAQFSIDDSAGISMTEIRSRCRKFKREHNKLDLIVIDYLQLIGRSGNLRYENREREISEISRNLKGLAKELDVPVISLAQLNRGPDSRPDKRPRMSDLRESGSMEQDADLVLFIYRDEYYHQASEDAGKAELILGKNRHGPMNTINLAFHSDFVSFHNLAPEN